MVVIWKFKKINKELSTHFPRAYWWGILTIIGMIGKSILITDIASTLFLIMGIFRITRSWDEEEKVRRQ